MCLCERSERVVGGVLPHIDHLNYIYDVVSVKAINEIYYTAEV